MTATVRRRTGWNGFTCSAIFGRLSPPAVIIQQNSNPWKVAGLIALVTIILLLYAASRSWLRTLIVLLTVPFSAAGAIWFL
jgi:multidrug efflux pump subunit AcrB